MHISRLSLKRDASSLGKVSALLRDGLHDGRAHRLLWSLFQESPPDRRAFLFRSGNGRKPDGDFMTVSPAPPVDETNLWQIETKPYNPCFDKGRALGFKLRLNPTVESKRKRYDLVAKIKHELEKPDERAHTNGEVWEIAAKRWLEPRAERLGVSFLALRADGYEVHKFEKGKDGAVSLAVLDASGVLKVEEAGRLKTALFTGIGKGRAWGCGLLLVKPV
ncbi:MAG: cse3 [Rhodospirillaceae bacterium]|nr:MAG: cse3 [Rhodospirillaceae bacterium]